MASRDRRTTIFFAAGLLLCLLLAGVVSSFASSSPDGLERVAEDEGFVDDAEDHALADGPLADYAVDGVEGDASGGLAGIIGVGVTLAVGAGAFALVRARRRGAGAGRVRDGAASDDAETASTR
jgi:hypothetical protein